MSHYVPARWRTALRPAPDVTRVLGTDGHIWLATPVRVHDDGACADVFMLLEADPSVSQTVRVGLDAVFILAVTTHDEAVAMLLRGFPNAELLSWEVPE